MSKIGADSEIELGCTGGEDGVDNGHGRFCPVHPAEDIDYAYTELSKISPRVSVPLQPSVTYTAFTTGNAWF